MKAAASNAVRGAPRLTPEVRGAAAVGRVFLGSARAAQGALAGGTPGAAWASGGQPRVVWTFKVVKGRIVEAQVVADPKSIAHLEVLL